VNAYNSYNALVNWFTTFWVHEREAYIKHPYHFATTDHNLNLVQKIKFIIKQPVIDLDTLASFAIFHSMCNRSMFMHAHIADTFSSRSKDRHYLVHLFTEACSFAYINLQHNCKDPMRIHVNKLIMYYLWTKVSEQKKNRHPWPHMRIYHVRSHRLFMDISYTWTNKFYKKIKNFTHVLSILLYLCTKFQVQITMNEWAVKKTKILIDLNS
jgi:hypothetical protein